nr:MAG TPA: hypothetical protein [Caudoviricetes sp.]
MRYTFIFYYLSYKYMTSFLERSFAILSSQYLDGIC